MNLDGDDDGVERNEVVYVPVSVVDQFMTSATPDAVLQDNAPTPQFLTTLVVPPGKHFYVPQTEPAFYVIVASTLPVRIEGSDIVVNHGYQQSQPMVLDATGAKAFKPSCKAAAVQSTSDWIDAPPAGSASVGVWSFRKSSPSAYGLDAGLRFRISSGQDPSLQADDSTLDIVVGLPWVWTYYDTTAAWCSQALTLDPATPGDLSAFVSQVGAMASMNLNNFTQNGLSVTTRYFSNAAFFLFVRLQAVPVPAPTGKGLS